MDSSAEIAKFRDYFVSKVLNPYMLNISTPSQRLSDSIAYVCHNHGKCVRPFIFNEFLNFNSNYSKQERESLLSIAAAIEMIHIYSLMHDDLPAMDNDDYRRGNLTVHKKFSESIAILSGSGLLTDAFNLIVNNKSTHLSSGIKLQLISEISNTAGFNGIIGGQALDIECTESQDFLNIDELLNIYKLKTAKMFTCSSVMPLYISQCSSQEIESAKNYGEYTGLLFQMHDDLEDVIENKDISDGNNIFLKGDYSTILEISSSICYKGIESLKKLNIDEGHLKNLIESIHNKINNNVQLIK